MIVGKISEMVSKSHPDMVCGVICDTLLDLAMSKNKHARCGIEAMVSPNKVTLAGEIGGASLSEEEIDVAVRSAVRSLGYTKEEYGFCADTLKIDNNIHQQSADIAMGVVGDDGHIKGAGDIGLMFGYACNATKAMIPLQLFIPRELMRLHDIADQKKYGIRPDAKCEIALSENKNVLVMCVSHDEGTDVESYCKMLINQFTELYPEYSYVFDTLELHVNPTGNFVIMGPMGDSGLNGRKIVAVQYGGACPVGGGAFEGKCPSKVDRSAAYMARYLATEIIRNFSGKPEDEVTIGLGYSIGEAQPVSIEIRSNFLSKAQEQDWLSYVQNTYDLSPQGICDFLGLKDIKYVPTAVNGHFGVSIHRDEEDLKSFPWEKIALLNQAADE